MVSPSEVKIIDEIISLHENKTSSVIPILQAVQSKLGCVSPEFIEHISARTKIPSAQIYGVATFYSQFRLSPVGKNVIKVCHGTACHVAGAAGISESIAKELSISPEGGTSADKLFTLESVACLGCCSLAPVAMIGEDVHAKLTRADAARILDLYRDGESCACKNKKDPFENVQIEKIDQGPREIERVIVGLGSCGIASGAKKTFDVLSSAKQKFNLDFQLCETGCIGMCHSEPLVELIARDGTRYLYGHVDEKTAAKIVTGHVARGEILEKKIISQKNNSGEIDFLSRQKRIVLENCGKIDPENITEYVSVGGYSALKKVLLRSPESIIEEIRSSGLRGRGGAGFSTGLKWEFARRSAGNEKYIICNADEGDPGAFMDRSVLESDPHRVLEGMVIAGFAIGANAAYIYCRAEYPLAVKRLRKAIEDARKNNFIGKNILGSQFSFDINVKEGAGAFVCGEETALIASIEGKRGMPNIRPPFPAEKGLFGKPTSINNVETFANVPWIINHGAEKFSALGTEKSKGTKVFALAGNVKRGGLVEVPMGMTLGEVIEDIGGGTDSGLKVKAVQLGGPSGGCLPSNLINVRVDYEEVNATGAIMGSGGMVVMDESACMVDIAKFFIAFTQSESCGKCTFCRIGTRRQLEILNRICEGDGRDGDIELLEELSHKIKDASLCGLGQTAPNPVLTTIKYFRDEYEAHIKHKKCPAGKCRALIEFDITDACIGCAACVKACPVNCISGEKKKLHRIDKTLCTKCGACKQVCPVSAVLVK